MPIRSGSAFLGAPSNYIEGLTASTSWYAPSTEANAGPENLASVDLREVWRHTMASDRDYVVASLGMDRKIGGAALVGTTLASDARLRVLVSDHQHFASPAFSLDGSSSAAANNANFSPRTGMGFAAWVKVTTIGATPQAIATGGKPWGLSILKTGTNPKLRFHYYHSSGTSATVDSAESAALTDAAWVHVAVTVTTGTTLTFYVNGSSIGTATLAASTRDAATTPGMTLAGGISGCNSLTGALDEVTLWNSYSSGLPSLIANHYRDNMGEWQLAPVAYYNFDAKSGANRGTETSATLTFSGTEAYVVRDLADYSADTGWVDAFGSTGIDEETFSTRRQTAVALFDSEAEGLYLCVQIDPGSTSGTTFEVGHLVAGRLLQPSISATYPWGVRITDPSSVERSTAGTPWAEVHTPFRTQVVSFADLPQAELLEDVMPRLALAKGITRTVVYIPDASDLSLFYVSGFFGRVSALGEFRNNYVDAWDWGVEIEEVT